MSSGAEKLRDNKSIAILDAAERGGYGVVSVVCVCLKRHPHFMISIDSNNQF